MPRQSDELTVEQAALLLARTPRRIRQLIAAGALAARHEGEDNRKTHYIPRDAAERLRELWQLAPPRPGRPKRLL